MSCSKKTVDYIIIFLLFSLLSFVAFLAISPSRILQSSASEKVMEASNPLIRLLYPIKNEPVLSKIQFQYIDKHDPVYSKIFHNKVAKLSPLAREIVCTPHFQRLFKTCQLGNNMIAFEHAFGSRASHCKGVAKLSTTFAVLLAENSNIILHPAEILAVQIAGLLHDVGHGPYSHVFESIANRTMSPNSWDHETNSKGIVKYLFNKNDAWMAKYSLPADFVEAVCDMIVGIERIQFQSKYNSSAVFKRFFVFTIVNAIHEHQLDADKMDYLMRDSYLTTKLEFCEALSSHVENAILNAKVINDAITFSASTSYDLYHIAKSYYLLYRYIYYSPRGCGADLLLKDAFEQIGPALDVKDKLVCLEKFAKLTDSFIEDFASYAIMHRYSYPLAAELFERFLNGQMYDLGGYRDFFYHQSKDDKGNLTEIATGKLLAATPSSITSKDFIFKVFNLSFLFNKVKGTEAANPLQRIPFYGVSFLQNIFEPPLTYANGEFLFSHLPELDLCGYDSAMHAVHFGSLQLRLYIRTLDPIKSEIIKNAFATLSFEQPF
ncbi:hypothetical protein DI09_209p20 [Mitosporidium daphniae]|uniref:HD/PDEase domain-containing protein n=1 Tax=Mitosporidium daphniae TaxID=1485682 RepID=A0A098VWI1_9MICR|nr:uncharacterized protein DI09_209p20 [Mitosporidium daphniae]KGG52116.1 hypothetical protein DI09_209p20 [Mitosporidium daphniae]|eukprot:XP_013238552.1 uncharacterized protein DI09_209p20 [Mitosporidium daphniae]